MEKEALAKLQKKMQKRDVIKPEATISASFAGVCDLTVTRERLAKVQAAVDVHRGAAPFFPGVFSEKTCKPSWTPYRVSHYGKDAQSAEKGG